MAQTKDGADRVAAQRIGISLEEYLSHKARGEKWCWKCTSWKTASISFVHDISRGDTYKAICNNCSDEYRRTAPKPRGHKRQRGGKHYVARVPSDIKNLLLEQFSGQCAYCDNNATTWDHIIPVTRNGTTIEGNIVPACASCNSSKGNRDLFIWLLQKEKKQAKISDITDVMILMEAGHGW